jgi:hypothetical protein
MYCAITFAFAGAVSSGLASIVLLSVADQPSGSNRFIPFVFASIALFLTYFLTAYSIHTMLIQVFKNAVYSSQAALINEQLTHLTQYETDSILTDVLKDVDTEATAKRIYVTLTMPHAVALDYTLVCFCIGLMLYADYWDVYLGISLICVFLLAGLIRTRGDIFIYLTIFKSALSVLSSQPNKINLTGHHSAVQIKISGKPRTQKWMH